MSSFSTNSAEIMELSSNLGDLHIYLDLKSATIRYANKFKPIVLNFDLVFVRHGETYGNCGQSTSSGEIDNKTLKFGIRDPNKRIFQGNVDGDINQLTPKGRVQAKYAAHRIKDELYTKGWQPDIIYTSPLNRAIETASEFIKEVNHEDVRICKDLREISFGAWENRRICDIEKTNSCHLFYLKQNALVKEDAIDPSSGKIQKGECFCELLLRTHHLLTILNETVAAKNIIIFSHSMVGAACMILLGKGQYTEDKKNLAFDGMRLDGSPYTMPYATPIILNKRV